MKKRNLKGKHKIFNDSSAFKLLSSLLCDFERVLPPVLYKFIAGRVRAHDYEFVISDFPDAVLPLLQADVSGAFCFRLAGRWFDSGDHPVRTIQCLYAASCFLKKYKFKGGDSRYNDEFRERNAIKSFAKAEKWCYIANKHVESSLDDDFVKEARSTILWLIGQRPDIDSILNKSYFGPGVNVGVDGSQTDAQFKFSLDCTMTPHLRRYLLKATDMMPGFFYQHGLKASLRERGYSDGTIGTDDSAVELNRHHHLPREAWKRRYERYIALGFMEFAGCAKSVNHNKLCSVPKNAKITRIIGAEAMLNSFIQNGVGVEMRDSALARTDRLDLTDQTRNAILAQKGSEHGTYATIDLSSASDTICLAICRLLFPRKWFELFRVLRSPYYEINGVRKKANKISSQGNGFTFPLESILFYAICRTAIVLSVARELDLPIKEARGVVMNRSGIDGLEPSVYGDDMIVPNEYYDEVTRYLELCGFWPNLEKSYNTGPFRESCGSDYHYGDFVRPLFLKDPLKWISQPVTLINQIVDPSTFGWLSSRYDLSFSRLVGSLSDIAKELANNRRIPLGPITGSAEPGHLCCPSEVLKSLKDHCLYDDARQRFVYKPIKVVAKKSDNVSDFGVMLKSLHNHHRVGRGLDFFSVTELLIRGKVKLEWPNDSKKPNARTFESLPSVDSGEIPENIDVWIRNWSRYPGLTSQE